MAYQNVGTPRFYINDIDYYKSIGQDILHAKDSWISEENALNLLDSDINNLSIIDFNLDSGAYGTGSVHFLRPDTAIGTHPNYVAILNHNLSNSFVNVKHSFRTEFHSDTGIFTGTTNFNGGHEANEIVNSTNGSIGLYHSDDGSEQSHGQYILHDQIQDGFTIFEIDDPSYDGYHGKSQIMFAVENTPWEDGERPIISIGGIMQGRYYDMPHSPELDVTMTIENDGYDSITTQGGAHLNNIRYNGAPMWKRADGSEIPPWTIGEPTAVGRRRGRRVWSMNFKYLSDKDLFASNYMSNTYAENLDGYVAGDKDIPNWSANLITNGTFDTTSSWTASDGATIDDSDNNKCILPESTSAWARITQEHANDNTNGIDYKLKYKVVANTLHADTLFQLGGGGSRYKTSNTNLAQTVGTHEYDFTSNNDGGQFVLQLAPQSSASSGTIEIDDVSLVQSNRSDFYHTLDTDDSFHAQVLNKIGNGQRFIFQPDNTNNNPDQFAICQLDQNSLNIKQVANGVYDISLKIREVW